MMIYSAFFRWLIKQVSVDPETKQVEMSFRTGVLKPSEALSAGDLQIGQKVDGIVKRIEDYGLFIQIDGSKLSGLCHKSQVRAFRIIEHISFTITRSSRITKMLMSHWLFVVSGRVIASRLPS
jgi:ribosomal protein S1